MEAITINNQIVRVGDTIRLGDGRVGILKWNTDSMAYEVYLSESGRFVDACRQSDLFNDMQEKIESGYSEQVTALFDELGVGSRFAIVEVVGKVFVCSLKEIEVLIKKAEKRGYAEEIKIRPIPNGGHTVDDVLDHLLDTASLDEADESEIVYADMEWVKDDELGCFINAYQDYEYASGGFVPPMERVGRFINGELVLDRGVFFASNARYTHDPDEDKE